MSAWEIAIKRRLGKLDARINQPISDTSLTSLYDCGGKLSFAFVRLVGKQTK